ncbi:MAG: S8 family serine peptidase [Vicinamibacteria bacterium]
MARDASRRRIRAALGAALAACLASAGAAEPPSRLTPRLLARLDEASGGEPILAWVYFADHGPATSRGPLAAVSPRALARRALRGEPGTVAAERGPSPAYLAAVEASGARPRHLSRWLNAVSVEAGEPALRALASLPFVARVDVLRSFARAPEPPGRPLREDAARARARARRQAGGAIDYGGALPQLELIGVPALHDRGLTGAGVVVAVLDSGFDNLAHEALAPLRVAAAWDFVNGDPDVGDGTDRGDGSHGTATLSALAGDRPGELVGPAFGASFLLAKTEDSTREAPIEEDHWAAAIEWAEAQGADVVSSSLGYLTFDPGFPSYLPSDLNGAVAVTTLAAEAAAERGLLVVSSAGNGGWAADRNTLNAPADGPRVLAVGAVDMSGARAGFSSVGPTADGRIKPDLAAPGVGVKVASSTGPAEYRQANGTSFSCPLTAGAAALLVEENPGRTLAELLRALRETARGPRPPDVLLGYGILDAAAASAWRPE